MEESVLIPDNLEVPDFNPELQYLGEPTLDSNGWFFPVIDYSENDLKAIKIYKAEFDRQKALNIEGEKKILADTLILSDSDALEKQSMFPIWEKLEDGFAFRVNEKYQSFDGMELKLFKVIQQHSKQSNWNPLAVPALFIRVALENEILPWVQPTGAQDAYQIGDRVTHKGFTWESINANNVWEPGVFGWKKI
jgi:hypothetical protein